MRTKLVSPRNASANLTDSPMLAACGLGRARLQQGSRCHVIGTTASFDHLVGLSKQIAAGSAQVP